MAEKERTASRDRTGAVLLFGPKGAELRETHTPEKNSLPNISRESENTDDNKPFLVNSSLTKEQRERRG